MTAASLAEGVSVARQRARTRERHRAGGGLDDGVDDYSRGHQVRSDGDQRADDGVPSLKLHQNVEWIERETIRQALAMSTDEETAASLMGISPRALSHYLTKHAKLDQMAARADAELASASTSITN